MSAALERPIGPNTVADWLTTAHPDDGGRLELIWGHLHVSPPPSAQHRFVADALCRALWDAVRASGRNDLCPVSAVGVRISTPWRTALIPDVALLSCRPRGESFPPGVVELVVEVWSPANRHPERESKRAAYAAAGIPYLWTAEHPDRGPVSLRTCELDNGAYRERTHVAAPLPVSIDLDDLEP